MKEHVVTKLRKLLAEGVAWDEYKPEGHKKKRYYSGRSPKGMHWTGEKTSSDKKGRGSGKPGGQLSNRLPKPTFKPWSEVSGNFTDWFINLIAHVGSKQALAKELGVDWRYVHRWHQGTKPKGTYSKLLRDYATKLGIPAWS